MLPGPQSERVSEDRRWLIENWLLQTGMHTVQTEIFVLVVLSFIYLNNLDIVL